MARPAPRRARVVVAPDAEGQTIEDGEVLVSIQSSPALMPLLRRCGAIVTDDGGVACHAAIICRELRKPTLIGTGAAISLIRTGDLVEVDTYAGTVRILERAAQPRENSTRKESPTSPFHDSNSSWLTGTAAARPLRVMVISSEVRPRSKAPRGLAKILAPHC